MYALSTLLFSVRSFFRLLSFLPLLFFVLSSFFSSIFFDFGSWDLWRASLELSIRKYLPAFYRTLWVFYRLAPGVLPTILTMGACQILYVREHPHQGRKSHEPTLRWISPSRISTTHSSSASDCLSTPKRLRTSFSFSIVIEML